MESVVNSFGDDSLGIDTRRLAVVTVGELVETDLTQRWSPANSESIDEVVMISLWVVQGERKKIPEPPELESVVQIVKDKCRLTDEDLAT